MQKNLSLQSAQNSLYLDIQQFYSYHTGYRDEELLSNKALLNIIRKVFAEKPIINCLSQNADLLSFNKENLDYLDECLKNDDLSKENIRTIITNCIAIVNKEIITLSREPNEKELSKFRKNHFDIISVVNRIREYYGFQCKTLKQLEIEFIIKEVLLIILHIILLFISASVFVLATWWSKNPPIIQQSGTNWFSTNIINPMSNWFLNSVLPITNQNTSTFAPFIFFAGIFFLLLFLCSVWINKINWNRKRLQYQIHFLCRTIGIVGEEIQNIGWL